MSPILDWRKTRGSVAESGGRAFMQMQACGQPPEEIVQDLAPGLAFGEDGLPQLPASATDKCTIC